MASFVFLNLPKWEGAGGAWHPGLPEGRNTSQKVQKEAAVARAKIERRQPHTASAGLEAV